MENKTDFELVAEMQKMMREFKERPHTNLMNEVASSVEHSLKTLNYLTADNR